MHKDACQRGTTLFPMNTVWFMDSCMHVTYVNGIPFRVQLPGSNTSFIHQFLSPCRTSLMGGSPAVMSCSSLWHYYHSQTGTCQAVICWYQVSVHIQMQEITIDSIQTLLKTHVFTSVRFHLVFSTLCCNESRINLTIQLFIITSINHLLISLVFLNANTYDGTTGF